MSIDDVIHDWNDSETAIPGWREGLEFYDESLRDGIQSPSATTAPPLSPVLATLATE